MARQSPELIAMLSGIEKAVSSADGQVPARIAGAIQPFLGKPGLLAADTCMGCPDGYIRHLLHANSAARYAVVALVWKPGQMSPVHAHRTWCTLGVQDGTLTEGHYALPGGHSPPRQIGSRLLNAGAVSYGTADPRLIHRLANLGMKDAISIHIYGAAFDRFGSDVNHIY
ncbi:MAG: cysteine dioxygenase [Roseomonas sp.]|jgi:predicted metal-dependent enzyme (double-stranded beta helix superfamily)|nr:cysteine dioxygenase [Roseomonas sp.]